MDRKVNRPRIDSPQFYEYLLKNIKLASIFILNEKGLVLDINNAVSRTYGYEIEDIKGTYFSFLFTVEDQQAGKPEEELTSVLTEGEYLDYNYVMHKNGSPLWSHGESAYTEDINGNVFIIKLIYELDKEKALEKHLINFNEELLETQEKLITSNQQLNSLNSSLQRMLQDLDNFVYTASHDLKAPVNNIEALLTALEEELSVDSKKTSSDVLKLLTKSIQKLQRSIADLSAIGKIQSGFKEDLSKVYFAEILEEVKIALSEEIKRTRACFIENIQEVEFIHFSRKNLRSILYNLISNAIKYRAADRAPEVKISTAKTVDGVVLSVGDNGLGIKEENKEKVFQMYSRLHSHVEGSGVGMAIVARIVDNSGGRIEVDSEVGKGSTFNIYFKQK